MRANLWDRDYLEFLAYDCGAIGLERLAFLPRSGRALVGLLLRHAPVLWFLPNGAIFECLGSRFGGAALRSVPNISPARSSRTVYPGGLLKAFGAGVRVSTLCPVTPRASEARWLIISPFVLRLGPSHANCRGAPPFWATARGGGPPIARPSWSGGQFGYLVDPASSICLSQRLSHASLSTHGRYSETANGSLNQLWFL